MADMIDNGTFDIYQWTFCSAAIVVTCGRFFIRLHRFNTLKADDFFNGLALASLITYIAINQVELGDIDPILTLKLDMATNMLLWMTLYFVKASFLALIIQIFNVSVRFCRVWWAVTIYTFLSFWPIFFSELWQCGSPADYANLEICNSLPIGNQGEITRVLMRFVLHITSDCLILGLPVVQIARLQMSNVKKLSVAAVFALIIFDIAIGIVRNVSVICAEFSASESGSSLDMAILWEIGEPAVAVIVCALPAYQTLIRSSAAKRRDSPLLPQEAGEMGRTRPYVPIFLTTSVDEGSFAREIETGPFF